ncbi:phosphotransferase [Nocardioides iriomotensis]|uniref:Aminoglycoside phosphotransferase family protein n=1 Tax=Nocardioides iriomotensis TaxID=715784 RepID=A0A4V1Z1E7_9ACTN|nr:phosphotransferase [Nocardioides iriomotensis]RYU10646.1 aminoglycoside phosphotransferase family protein [Nocardioides iriomotensis]
MTGGGGPYRDRLEILASDGVIEGHLDAWASRQRSDDGLGSWRRVYAKLRPQRSPWAVLVYQAVGGGTVQVRLLETTDRRADVSDAVRQVGGLGPLEIVPCEEDRALPGLAAVLASLENPRVVRYHPGNRCTVRGGAGSAARFVKVFADPVDDQVEVRARWDASASGALSFAVAEPHGWDEESRSSWYGIVPGQPALPRLLGADGTELARQVGASLGELAVAGLEPRRSDDATSQLARTELALARAAAASPALAPGLRRASDALTRAHARLAPRRLAPVHGAAHLGQWLVDDTGRLGLVDFDRYAWGEPEFDLATFVAELRASASSRGVASEQLEDAVLDSFRAVAGEVDAERLALYTMHRRLTRVVQTACELRPDAEERAARRLEELLPQLDRLVTT